MPPVLFIAAMGLMALLHYQAPGPVLIAAPYNTLGWIPFAAGVGITLWVNWRFRRADTTIRPFRQSTALVTDGPFAHSRNPIYVSMAAGLVGIALVFGTLTPVIAVPLFVLLIRRRFIAVEEAMLEEAFGDDYRAYKARVRRWL